PAAQCLYVANNQDPGTPIAVFTINPSTGALTTAPAPPMVVSEAFPASIAVHPTGKFAYVANNSGNVSVFAINSSTCALTRMSPVAAGTFANFATIDPLGKFLYVANLSDNDISGYTINSSTGALTPIIGSPFAAGSVPMSVSVDPTGQFAFETSSDSNVLVYSINSTT